MEEADSITLLAQIVMEDHETLMEVRDLLLSDHKILINDHEMLVEDHSKLEEVRSTVAEHSTMLIETRNALTTVVEILGRMERKLDATAALSARHEKWIVKTAPVVDIRYPMRP